MGADNEIKAETGTLLNVGASIASNISQIEELIWQLGEIVRRTSSYWTGEAGDRYRNIYFQQEESRQEILQRLNDDPNKLSEIADIFDNVSKTATQAVAGLPSDICDGV